MLFVLGVLLKSGTKRRHCDVRALPLLVYFTSNENRNQHLCLFSLCLVVLPLLLRQEGIDAKDVASAPMADMAVGAAATPSCPFLPPAPSDETGASDGASCQPCVGTTTKKSTAAAGEDGSFVPSSRDDFKVVELPSVGGGDDEAVDREESVEDLLSSLMRTLNTEQGRADFRKLAATGLTS